MIVIMGGGLAAALVHGWRTIGTVVAVDPHGQVVFAKGDHATAQGTDGPLAPHPLLEVEADEDPEPEDKLADFLVGIRVGCQGAEVVDRRHQGVDLFLGRLDGRRHGLWSRKGVDLSPDVSSLLGKGIKGPGDRSVAGIVTFGSHPPLGGGDVTIELSEPFTKQAEFMRLPGDGFGFGLRPGPLEQPLADGLAATGFADQFHERGHEHGRQRARRHRVVGALGVAAVVVAAAHVLGLLAVGDAVHHTPAAVGHVNDPRRERVALGVGGLASGLPANLGDIFRLLGLECPPAVGIEE